MPRVIMTHPTGPDVTPFGALNETGRQQVILQSEAAVKAAGTVSAKTEALTSILAALETEDRENVAKRLIERGMDVVVVNGALKAAGSPPMVPTAPGFFARVPKVVWIGGAALLAWWLFFRRRRKAKKNPSRRRRRRR